MASNYCNGASNSSSGTTENKTRGISITVGYTVSTPAINTNERDLRMEYSTE